MGRPTAPRVASMLEMGKFRDCETRAAAPTGRRHPTVTPTTTRAARLAAGLLWYRHRDIVILKTRRGTGRRNSSSAVWRRCHDPGRAASRFPAGRFVASSAQSSLRVPSPADHSGEPSDGPTTRPDVIRASRGPSHDSPGKCPARPSSESTARTQSEFVTRLK
jgi:hypothetical protein